MLSLVSLLAPSVLAHAQTGVSDDRVSLPDGPGSVEGVGDNVAVNPNMGGMSYGASIELPAGHQGATPSLGLSYSSNAGQGIVGLGWSLGTESIERLTLRGLPDYDADDEFAANEGDQLVRVAESGTRATYRARYESGFVRYTWYGRGAAGYWTAEWPDGRVGYFGANADGQLVAEARLAGSGGQTFRYHLVEVVDVFGHRLRYDYQLIDGAPYLAGIAYVFDGGGQPRYQVALRYESRNDTITDCKPGFCQLTTRRLQRIDVSANGEVIRSYHLTYDDPVAAGGVSRLGEFVQYGRSGGEYPIRFSFRYSSALGELCDGSTCDGPYMVQAGNVPAGLGLTQNNATLVDLNGDALPDFVDATDTANGGAHRIYYAQLLAGERSQYSATPTLSATATRNDFLLSQPNVQVMDINGDGFADLVNTLGGGRVRCNHGDGDWSTTDCGVSDAALATLSAAFLSAEGADAQGTRMLDIDNDRRIDVIRTIGPNSTQVYHNTGSGFALLSSGEIDHLEQPFSFPNYTLAEINGDGLLDYVHLNDAGQVEYRANLGNGRWAPMTAVPGSSLQTSQLAKSSFEDLNADGLDDLVMVEGSRVTYFLNRSGRTFDSAVVITGESGDPNGGAHVVGVPYFDEAHMLVLYADMNGNGSRDVVWIEDSGDIQYLELFPVPPNLLSRIENGIGSVQEVAYNTSLENARVDDHAWPHPLPHSVTVVGSTDTWVTLSGGENGAGLHEVVQYRYSDGYYDIGDKQFRGFQRVAEARLPDSGLDSQEGGRVESEYETGAEDSYRHGLMRVQRVLSGVGAEERALSETHTEYADCNLAEATPTAGGLPVRHICPVRNSHVLQEGASPAEWATVVTETEYDGYGNVVLQSQLGVAHMGGIGATGACGSCNGRGDDVFGAPCGARCRGDELYTATEYIAPGANTDNRWILGRHSSERTYGRADGPTTEHLIYYDGPEFVGLPLGSLSRGEVTRETARVDASSPAVVETTRSAYDTHGNVVAQLDPLGSPQDDTVHRRSYTYDSDGLRVVRAEVHVATPEGAPYRLRRDVIYDAAFDQVSEGTAWMVVEGNAVRSARNARRFRYDEFGRRVAILQPGDPDTAPTSTVEWELASPASAIRVRTRSVSGAAADLETVTCVDGRGREFQTRTRLSANSFQVSGFRALNSRGGAVREYQPYIGADAACAVSAPMDVLHEDVRYDVEFREVGRTLPDAELHGSASETRTVYGPLSRSAFDAEDLAAGGRHANTPVVESLDGLGRIVAVERRLTSAGVAGTTRAEYDSLGRLSAIVDDAGHRKVQGYDLMGRLTSLSDPNSGPSTFSHDSAGNVVSARDARGVVTRTAFDGVNRPARQWVERDQAGTEVRFRYDFGGSCEATSCSHAAGRPIEVTYPLPMALTERIGGSDRGVDHIGYDARGRPSFEARTLGGYEFATRHEFDNADRHVAVVHPDGRRVTTAYDAANHPLAIDGFVDAFAYDGRGQLERMVFGNGTVERWGYDALRRLDRTSIDTGDGHAIQSLTYERDRVGNVLSLRDTGELPVGWGTVSTDVTYDAWYRTTAVDYARGNGTEAQRFTFDTLDNLRSATSSRGSASAMHLGELTYDEARPNALVDAGGITLGYDSAGNLVTRGDTTLSWDHLGRLESASRGGREIATMAYGAAMSRVAAVEGNAVTLYVSADFEVRDAVGVLYVRAGARRIARAESDTLAPALLADPAPIGMPDDVVTAADAWVSHARATGLLGGSDGADPALCLRSAARRMLMEHGDGQVMLHHDHLGNIVAATDADGVERGRRRFVMVDGEDAHSGCVDRYGFTGQEEFASLGLVRFQHRWLDTVTRRWARPDPAFAAVPSLGLSRAGEIADPFGYVGNQWFNTVDPLGLMLKALAKALPATALVASQRSSRRLSTSSSSSRVVSFRGDRRAPDQIFKDGFKTLGSSRDLRLHAENNQSPPSDFVSTSKSSEVAAKFAGDGGHVYTVDSEPGVPIDVNRTLGHASPYPHEQELAIPGGVPPSHISEARHVGTDGRPGAAIPNPSYTSGT